MQSPTLEDVRLTSNRLKPHVVRTPVTVLQSKHVESIGTGSVTLKLELMQLTGTFKLRAAVNNLLHADSGVKKVTAVSAGNHAVAVACASSILGFDAKIAMMQSANPARRALAESFGAELLYRDTGVEAFALAEQLVVDEKRLMIHPFDGFNVASATGCVALELLDDVKNLDAVVVAIGGGGLAGGVANVVKQLSPTTKVYGVEPTGADCMSKSFESGQAVTGQTVNTIADSLAPPLTTEYSYKLCRDNLDELVQVTDDEICGALHLLFADAKLAVEPAGAAAMAGVTGPLRDRLVGKNVGIIVCGACLDAASFGDYLTRGHEYCSD